MTTKSTTTVRHVDFSDQAETTLLVDMLDAYARDSFGGGEPLPSYSRENLGIRLGQVPNGFSLIAYVDAAPAGFTNCFESFSTFKCQPLINIHDLAVMPDHRGKGISLQLLQAVEDEARTRGCCKVTLEVLTGNAIAKSAYRKFGFSAYELDPKLGLGEFWQKDL